MRTSREGDRPLPRVALALACLYAPYSWLVLIDHPWDTYRWHWIKLWPVLPGLLVHAVPVVHRQPDWLSYLAMGGVTALIIAPTILSSGRSRRAALITAAVVVLLSSANGWIAYQLFLA
jgi:hypothetical protein